MITQNERSIIEECFENLKRQILVAAETNNRSTDGNNLVRGKDFFIVFTWVNPEKAQNIDLDSINVNYAFKP